MFYELAQTCPSTLNDLALYPPAADRAAWNALDGEWKSAALQLGASYKGFLYPQLFATDFMDFTVTDNRVRFEDKYFARRHALDALVLAECVAHTGEYLPDIINGIFCLCEESAWQLPPHNSYARDTPQLPLPDSTEPVLDLFACETAAVLATASYLLGGQLDAVSPFIRTRIRHELETRIFTPYLSQHFWWMGNGGEPMNNWTVWCTQNVLLAVFLTDTDTELRRRVLWKACRSIDYFLAGYGEDGCCDEGALYYRHAGLCLFNALEVLNGVTQNHFAALYQEPKIRNIAAYIMHVHVQDKYYVNFADCSPVPGRCSAREFLFAKRTENHAMMAFAAGDFLRGLPDTLLLPEENNLYYRLQNAFAVREIRAFAGQEASAPVSHTDIYYPSVGLFIAGDDVYFLAAKAGSNGDSHNHNDTGSFTVYKNGYPLLIDVGVESYTKKTFSPQRYEIWTMQSAYHNLPTVNGCMQKDGKAYGAVNTVTRFLDDICEIQMDIAPAYPPESGLASYVRLAALHRGEGIRVHDAFSFTEASDSSGSEAGHDVTLSFMTYEKPVPVQPEPAGEGILLFQIGAKGSMRITGGALVRIETIPVTDRRLMSAWQHEIYRILVSAEDPEVDISIK